MTSPTLLVLAAGMGSRYGGLKQIDPVGPYGATIIDYSIYDALRAGFGKLVFVLRRQIEEPFRSTVGKRFEGRIPVEYVFQELADLPHGSTVPAGRTKPWGTAHAVLAAQATIREPFAVINADDFYGPASYHLLALHLRSGIPDAALAGFILRNTLSEFGSVARGRCSVGEDGMLQSIEELTAIQREGLSIVNRDAYGHRIRLTGDEIVSMNMWAFTPAIFPQLLQVFAAFLKRSGSSLQSECYLPTAVNELIHSGQLRVRSLSTAETWFGVTYRQDQPRVVENIGRLIHAGAYPERLWQ